MTTITRPCPHCGKDYDISRRMHGDRVYCLCGNWSAVVMFPDGRTELRPCDAPYGSAPAGETTQAAALLAELSAMRVELEAVKARERVLTTDEQVKVAIAVLKAYADGALATDLCDELDEAIEAAFTILSVEKASNDDDDYDYT